jgi:hypothetical protein
MTPGGSRSAVPYLPEGRIEEDAEALLVEYGRDRKLVAGPPVPVDELAEVQLQITVEIDDLRATFKSDDVLGAIWFKDRLIRIDRSLDPHEQPQLLGRFRFTLAHETGHWRLHRQHYREDPEQSHLFGGRGAPAFVCRSSDKAPVEWQADCFAGYLLMPRKLVLAGWQAWQGSLDPVILDTLPPAGPVGSRDSGNVRFETFCKPFARQFEVSAAAMRIRLEKLGLLLRERRATLF